MPNGRIHRQICQVILIGLATMIFSNFATAGGDNHGDLPRPPVDIHAHHTPKHDKSHKGSEGLPQFDPSTYPSQIFWLFVSFGILYLFFSGKTLPNIGRILENRREHIQSDIDTATQLRNEAEAVQKEYEDNLEESKQEASKIISQIHEKIEKKAEKHNTEFRLKSDESIKELKAELQNLKNNLMDDMNDIAVEVASEAALQIVGISTDTKMVQSVVKNISTKKKAA